MKSVKGGVALAMLMLLPLAGSASPAGKVEQALRQTEQRLLDSLLHGDASVFKATLADGFVFVAPDGSLQDRADFVADLGNGNLKMASSSNDDMTVRQYGDTAIVTYASTDHGTYKGRDISGHYRWTDVFAKLHGQWRIVATQGTQIAPPSKP